MIKARINNNFVRLRKWCLMKKANETIVTRTLLHLKNKRTSWHKFPNNLFISFTVLPMAIIIHLTSITMDFHYKKRNSSFRDKYPTGDISMSMAISLCVDVFFILCKDSFSFFLLLLFNLFIYLFFDFYIISLLQNKVHYSLYNRTLEQNYRFLFLPFFK